MGDTGERLHNHLTYHVWEPAGAAVSVEPYAADAAWTYHTLGTLPLAAGWNTVVVAIPPTWSGINDIGVQVDNGTSWTGTIALDAVAWDGQIGSQVILRPDPV